MRMCRRPSWPALCKAHVTMNHASQSRPVRLVGSHVHPHRWCVEYGRRIACGLRPAAGRQDCWSQTMTDAGARLSNPRPSLQSVSFPCVDAPFQLAGAYRAGCFKSIVRFLLFNKNGESSCPPYLWWPDGTLCCRQLGAVRPVAKIPIRRNK